MDALQAQLFEELISEAYDVIGAQPLSEQQEALLIQICWQQVEAASYSPLDLHSASGNQDL